jgi:hypothetical protein
MIFWGSLGLFTAATNAAVFANTNENIAPHWCDFAGIVGYCYPIGFAGGALCLLRRLESIACEKVRKGISRPDDHGFSCTFFLPTQLI